MAKLWLDGRRDKLELDRLDLKKQITDHDTYDQRLDALQIDMLRVQQAYKKEGLRGVIVFEGWDTAGKGGSIKRLTERLDPRGYHVWPIGPPTEEERQQHYLQRFWPKLPAHGRLAIFDRSWYGRVLVEKVEKLTPKSAVERAYRELCEFERMLTDDGVRVLKLFLHVSKKEEIKRLEERLAAPHKRWKLSKSDFDNVALRDEYVEAIETMFACTNAKTAPWFVVAGEHKWQERITVLELASRTLGEGVDLTPQELPKDVRAAAEKLLGKKTVKKLLKNS
jgi:AMP-polyphosphate phosphotransferase